MQKVFVVELNHYHTETFAMYKELLPSLINSRDLDIYYYVIPSKVQCLNYAPHDRIHKITNSAIRYFVSKTGLRSFYFTFQIKSLIRNHRPDLLIFNTIEPRRYLKVFRAVDHVKKIGIVHSPFEKGIEHNHDSSKELLFCLNDYNYNYLVNKIEVDGYFLPMFRNFIFTYKIPQTDKIKIAVQGIINFSKRDYPLLIEIAKRLNQMKGSPKLVFNIVGNIRFKHGPELNTMIRREGLDNYFILHGPLNDEEFFKEIYESDFIMPLITRTDSDYFNGRISASYSLSAAYNKPMIIHSHTAKSWWVPDDCCIAYTDMEDLLDKFSQISYIKQAVLLKYEKLINDKIDKNKIFLNEISIKYRDFFRTVY